MLLILRSGVTTVSQAYHGHLLGRQVSKWHAGRSTSVLVTSYIPLSEQCAVKVEQIPLHAKGITQLAKVGCDAPKGNR